MPEVAFFLSSGRIPIYEYMTTKTEEKSIVGSIGDMFKAGAHFAFAKSRRHPTFKALIFGNKNNTEILDLEKTEEYLKKALSFVEKLGEDKKTLLFVSSKSEARDIVRSVAERVGAPYVAGRWIGGTLTNFPEIKRRVAKLDDLTSKKEKNELLKYTKKERLLIDREIEKLDTMFSGIRHMDSLPHALFVVDPRKEHIAVTEAKKVGIPVVSLASSDCDLGQIDFPIPANDTARASIKFFADKIAESYAKGKEVKKAEPVSA